MSDLVRAAIHEKYFADEERRKAVLLSAIGIWKDRTDLPDTEEYVRSLRQGRRLKRLWG